MVVDGQLSLGLAVSLAVEVNRGRRVLVGIGVLEVVHSRRVGLHYFPTLSVVQLHPVVLAILNLASARECLGKEFA